MNFHQTPEEIINHATAEQRILWNYIFLRFGEKIGISQLYYMGISAGQEFLLYDANKMYLTYQFLGTGVGSSAIGTAQVTFFNSANAAYFVGANIAPVWDATAAALKYTWNNISLHNFLFSRLQPTGLTQISFIGYRLSI